MAGESLPLPFCRASSFSFHLCSETHSVFSVFMLLPSKDEVLDADLLSSASYIIKVLSKEERTSS